MALQDACPDGLAVHKLVGYGVIWGLFGAVLPSRAADEGGDAAGSFGAIKVYSTWSLVSSFTIFIQQPTSKGPGLSPPQNSVDIPPGPCPSWSSRRRDKPVQAKLQQRIAASRFVCCVAAFAIVEAQLGMPLGEVFSSITDLPVVAASLRQVYEALMRDTGECVAVKKQRPGFEPVILRDLFIFHSLARVANPWVLDRLGCKAE